MDDLELLSNSNEGSDGLVDLLRSVGSRELDTDASEAFRNHWVAEADNVDVVLQHLVSHVPTRLRHSLPCQLGISQPHRHDRTLLMAQDLEACLRHPCTELHRVVLQFHHVARILQHFEGFESGTDDGRGNGVGEEVRTAALAEHFRDFFASSGVATVATAESFAEGGVDYVDLRLDSEEFGSSAASLADESSGVTLIHEEHTLMLLRQLNDLRQWGDVSIHREDPVRDNEPVRAALGLNEETLEVSHVQVLVAETLGLAETNTIDNGGMVELIRDDGVFSTENALKYSSIGVKAARVENGVFSAMELADLLLQLLVDVLGPADESYGRHPKPVTLHHLLRRPYDLHHRPLPYPLVVRKSEVVVGTEVEDLLPLSCDLGALSRSDNPLLLVSSSCLDFSQLRRQAL